MAFIDYAIYTTAALTVLIFILSYLQDRRKLSNGYLFSIALFTSFLAIVYTAFAYDQRFLIIISIIGFVIILSFALFGGVIAAGASLWNAKILLSKEGFKKSNVLTLLFGLSIIGLFFAPMIDFDRFLFKGTNALVSYLIFLYFYFLFVFFNYLMASFLYHFYRPRRNKDYIIVLGSGLIDGHIVPPLLQSRINRAIAFYQKQVKEKGKAPILLFSGGQGPDEKLPEAVAMQQYAIDQGIPEEHTLIEDQSTTTYENMLFSKQVIENHTSQKNLRILFSTNNYHVFRAGIYAKMAGLNAQGIGAKIALYYWPNAMLREFVASLVMYKKWHIRFILLSALLFVILQLLQVFLN